MGWNKWERKKRKKEREIFRKMRRRSITSKEAKFSKKQDGINRKKRIEREKQKEFQDFQRKKKKEKKKERERERDKFNSQEKRKYFQISREGEEEDPSLRKQNFLKNGME